MENHSLIRSQKKSQPAAHNAASKSCSRTRSVRVISVAAGHPLAGASRRAASKVGRAPSNLALASCSQSFAPDDKALRAGALTKKNDKEQERRLAERRRSEGAVNPSVSLPRHPVRLRAAALPDVVLGR